MGGEGHSRTKRPSAWHQAWHPHCVPAAGAPPPRPGFWSPRTHSWEEKRTHCAKFRAGATSGSCHKGRSMRQEVGGLTGPRLSSQRRGEEEEEGEHVTWVYEWRQSCGLVRRRDSAPRPSQGRFQGARHALCWPRGVSAWSLRQHCYPPWPVPGTRVSDQSPSW